MKVIRYSFEGFKPQKQTHHMIQVNYEIFGFKKYKKKWFNKSKNRIFKHIALERHAKLKPFYKENYEDFQEGIWVFIDGYKNNQSLNHLTRLTPCFSAELPDNIEVYDVNWEKKLSLNDPIVKAFGCYIPTRCLKDIKNIRRVKRKG